MRTPAKSRLLIHHVIEHDRTDIPDQRDHVTFEHERQQLKEIPRWYRDLERGANSADELIEKVSRHVERAPSQENCLLLGMMLNTLGRTDRGAEKLNRVLTRDFIRRHTARRA